MSPWGLLTPRGRGLLCLGLAVCLLAVYRGQRDLLWLGLLLVLLPIAALVLLRGLSLPLTVGRRLDPPQVAVGDDVLATVVIDKERDLAGGLMLFEETVPATFGRRPRFTIHQTGGHPHREIEYLLGCRQRGRYRLGPLRVETRDTLGLVRVLRAHDATSELLVTPRVHPLPTAMTLAGVDDAGEVTPQRLGTAGEDDVLVREYRHGDDMRRVHWRSTARHRELMVRREEQTSDPLATVVLDSRAVAHAGAGPDSSFEWAVSAAASIAADLLGRGYRLQLLDASGGSLALTDTRESFVARQRMLEFLTDATLASDTTFTSLLAEAGRLERAQVVVAVLGSTSELEASRLASLRAPRGAAGALLVDTPTFTGRHEERALAEAELRLAGARWAVAVTDARTTVPDACARLQGVLS